MTNQALAIREDVSLSELGSILSKSGYFQDARDAGQAVVKVLAGRELGFGPVASMTGINIIQGRVSLSANLMAAAVKRSGRYNFKVRELTPEICRIEFFENLGGKWESAGLSEFSRADAVKAGTKNMDKYSRNMLYARAMSNGVKWYCPDVTGGPAYTPDELGAEIDGETGEIIDAKPTLAEVVKPEAEKPNGNGHTQALIPPSTPSPEEQAAIQKLEAYENAWQMLDGGGNPYGQKTTEKLTAIVNAPEAPADKKNAARIILEWRAEHQQA